VKRLSLLALLIVASCAPREAPEPHAAVRPSILLVTLDTTRADAIGPEGKGATPSFNALAARSLRFRQAYATAPQTLPSHSSMLTGLYPGGHGVHENARFLDARHALASERLKDAGYRTAAFVSSFVLARRFGLARGFDVYDDELPVGSSERSSRETTDRALSWLSAQKAGPVFLWVHYFDPHYPYAPSYLGEVAAMDAQLGRLVQGFEKTAGSHAIVVAADHGEGLGEHGEAQHGNLLYQGVMHVPLLVAAPDVRPSVVDTPVSIRRVFHTLLDLAGLSKDASLRGETTEVVLGEAMIPFLQFGWQPQVMAVEGRLKAIHAGTIEVYDVVADSAEARDLGAAAALSRNVRKALVDYPIPSLVPASTPATSDEERRQLASLGYVTADAKPVVRPGAPRPRDMAPLFETLDQASGAFVREEYALAIPLLEKIQAADPNNLMAVLRLAAAHSALGHGDRALAAFRQAESIAPQSPDVRHYLAMHYVSTGDWTRAAPLLERVVAESPDRLPALEALAESRERQGRLAEALELRRKVQTMSAPRPAQLIRTGELAMAVGDTAFAIESFERARRAQGAAFRHDLELGVLYLAARRFADARAALDRVPSTHPAYAMALFKRAQVSVLLNEAGRAERIARAREGSDATTRDLIANERLFR